MAAFDVTLDPSSPVPLYHQVARQLQAAVEEGRLGKGDFLPSEIELADSWGVSRPTARRAIQDLVEKGLLVRRRGVGTQIVSQQVRRPVRLSSLYDDLVESGRDPKTEVLLCEEIPADEHVADALDLPVGEAVLHIERLRSADGEPLAVMRNWLLLSAGGGLSADDLRTAGLYELLRRRGVRPRTATQVIGAGAARPDEARLLRLNVGAPVLYMRRIMEDDQGRVVELAKHAYDPTTYSMQMTVEVSG
ncbi:MAG TPA: GntR family transcriptional regulator [Euzebya sp.]|nr:GntR family transcriptional regulator [Euzebya sp.]